jgi:GNAT superfamily N-acetyltransferase
MVSIRPAQPNDEAALLTLVRLFPTPTPPDEAAYAAVFRGKLADENSYLAVAEQGLALVGYGSGFSHQTFYASGRTAWLDELFVLEQFRHVGIGRALVSEFESWAAQRNCKLVSLAAAGAGAFYEQLGYVSKAGYYKKYLTASP